MDRVYEAGYEAGWGGKTRGDLGRRAARRRAELGLSVEEVARRAGMAPGYVAYLEEHPPNLSRRALAWLAGALETTPGALLGADVDVPPGRNPTGRAALLQTLDAEECMDLIRPGGVGRIAFPVESEAGPTVLPVNFAVVDGNIVFRVEEGGIIAKHATGYVSFQMDRIDQVMSEGWSVLVKGRARLVRDPGEVDDLGAVQVRPWAGGDREAYVTITPIAISGRRASAGEIR
ncbi:helix-turn-helix domain-containing protein [Allosalinactinospora lopnorensis]|uniref:helix-turn-helix domain-containing protein n=1 Tax=Allosalinactinospora lopnorensis TaxID=1352348 RepID=UPI000623F09C|nr:pyridoxamine 5'-phosphate oxidase family protein [Allosalinactinospora lopnorensis]